MNEYKGLKIGDKVIVRSNEPEPLVIGYIREFFTNGERWTTPLIVVSDGTRDYSTLGHVRKYEEDLHVCLNMVKPIEQWNYLVRHAQIKEKYGVTYRTFEPGETI